MLFRRLGDLASIQALQVQDEKGILRMLAFADTC